MKLDKIYEILKLNNSPLSFSSILPIARMERANFFIFKIQLCPQSFQKWLSCVKKTPLKSSFLMFLVDPLSIDSTHRVFCAHFVRIPAHTLRHEYYRGAVRGGGYCGAVGGV